MLKDDIDVMMPEEDYERLITIPVQLKLVLVIDAIAWELIH